MRRLLLVLCLGLAANACAFDSPEATGIDVTIQNGKIRSSSSSEATLKSEIKAQLKYLIGHLFSIGSPALGHSIQITQISRRDRKEVHYQAKFLLGWDTTFGSTAVPSTLSVAVPASGDSASLAKFDKDYQSRCGEGSDPLWYTLWHADLSSCPLSANTPPANAVRLTMSLAPSANSSQGKFPEYQKIWEDGKLVVTVVGGNLDSHRGAQVEDLMEKLQQQNGAPISFKKTTLGSYTIYEAEFDTFGGKLVVRGFDIHSGNVQQTDKAFRDLFGKFSKESDLVAYNGHSSLGANIRAFTAMARHQPHQYSIYWLNACKPFAHLDTALFDGVRAVNPGASPSKYLDIMSVVNLGDFGVGSDVFQIISGLLQKKTFHQILYWLSSGQPAVIGEQDNAYPSPFIR